MLGFASKSVTGILWLLLSVFSSVVWADTGASSLSEAERLDQELAAEQLELMLAEERWEAVDICFDCHVMSEEVISQQPRRRQKKHRKAMEEQRSCLDCHTADDVACCHFRMFPEIERWE